MLAKDIMTTQVITIHPHTTIYEAMNLIVKLEISGLIVVDDNSDVVGVITEKDLLVAFDFLEQTEAPVADFMCRDLISATPETTTEEIGRILVQSNILRVPVLEGKKVVGIVSRRDILKSILKRCKKPFDA